MQFLEDFSYQLEELDLRNAVSMGLSEILFINTACHASFHTHTHTHTNTHTHKHYPPQARPNAKEAAGIMGGDIKAHSPSSHKRGKVPPPTSPLCPPTPSLPPLSMLLLTLFQLFECCTSPVQLVHKGLNAELMSCSQGRKHQCCHDTMGPFQHSFLMPVLHQSSQP